VSGGARVADPLELAERVGACTTSDNSLDVLVEIALFKPNKHYASVRANSAETKLIYVDHDGREQTCWSGDWTMADRREATIAALRARTTLNEGSGR
jgi:hypothetical protein